MPISAMRNIQRTGLTRLAFALLASATGAGAAPAWDPSSPGSAECTAAAQAADLDQARQVCRTGDGDFHPVDAYNLALALYPSAADAALVLLERAGDAGLAEADQLLGNLLLDRGEIEGGIARLERAARAGLALAQYDYATALLERGGSDDAAEAGRWYGWAAAGGDDAARYNIGVMLLAGRLGRADPLWAWAWFASMATPGDHDEVRRLAAELAGQMNADERARAAGLLLEIQRDPAAAAASAVTTASAEAAAPQDRSAS